MDRITELADLVRPRDGLRVVGGRVVQVVDSSHVLVDLGDKAVTAFGSAPVGADVRLLVGGGVVELIPVPPAPPAAVKIAGGSGSMSFSGSSTASDAETFPAGLFSAAPIVVASLRTSGLGIAVSVTNVTASGCTVRGITAGGTSITKTVNFDWIAYQP